MLQQGKSENYSAIENVTQVGELNYKKIKNVTLGYKYISLPKTYI